LKVLTLIGRTYTIALSDWIPASAGMTNKRNGGPKRAVMPPSELFENQEVRKNLMNLFFHLPGDGGK
jgi:hypothetical protein